MKFLVDAHLPRRLVVQLNSAGHDALHTPGNIHNADLLNLFASNLERIVAAFQTYSYVELDRHHLMIHQ